METDERSVRADLHEKRPINDPYQLNSQDSKDWHAPEIYYLHTVDSKKQVLSVAAIDETEDRLHGSRLACQD